MHYFSSYVTTSWAVGQMATAAICGAGGFKFHVYYNYGIQWGWENTLFAAAKVKTYFDTDFVDLPINERMDFNIKDQFLREPNYLTIVDKYFGDHMDRIVEKVRDKIITDPMLMIDLMENIEKHHSHYNRKLIECCIQSVINLKKFISGTLLYDQACILLSNMDKIWINAMSAEEAKRAGIIPSHSR